MSAIMGTSPSALVGRIQPANGEGWLCGDGLGQAADGQDRDVVFLAESFGGVSDVEGGLVAEVVHAIEAEEFAGGLAGFDHSIREHEDAVAGVEIETDFFVAALRQHAEW